MPVQTWESMLFSAEFLKKHLGPTMATAGYGDRKIIVWDHNRDMMVHRAHVIFVHPDASKYAWARDFIGTRPGRVRADGGERVRRGNKKRDGINACRPLRLQRSAGGA